MVHFEDVHQVEKFQLQPDLFFYIFEYSPTTKRLATIQGEIRVGPSHQVNSAAVTSPPARSTVVPCKSLPIARRYAAMPGYVLTSSTIPMCKARVCMILYDAHTRIINLCQLNVVEEKCMNIHEQAAGRSKSSDVESST